VALGRAVLVLCLGRLVIARWLRCVYAGQRPRGRIGRGACCWRGRERVPPLRVTCPPHRRQPHNAPASLHGQLACLLPVHRWCGSASVPQVLPCVLACSHAPSRVSLDCSLRCGWRRPLHLAVESELLCKGLFCSPRQLVALRRPGSLVATAGRRKLSGESRGRRSHGARDPWMGSLVIRPAVARVACRLHVDQSRGAGARCRAARFLRSSS